jgi:hypothetical protein
MMRLVFYRGPGYAVTKIIRLTTFGRYSHVELQFSDGCRLFSSGHGVHQGVHLICDRRVYGPLWDSIIVPSTQEQEDAAERLALRLIGAPFDWRGLFSFLFPFVDRRRKATYCSSIILDVLQSSLQMLPEVRLKISPSGLHRRFLAQHHLMISIPMRDVEAEAA